jgi:flavin-dependent dehydrogenase
VVICTLDENRLSGATVLDWDVIVVGASSAGLYAAAKLQQAGKRVAVFEQAHALNPARRTLIVTPHLNKIMPGLAAPVLLHRISDLALASESAETRVTLNDPDLIIERGALIHGLARDAAQAGVTLVLDRRFRTIRAANGGAELEFQTPQRTTMTTTARTVLGADGVFSDVAVAAGLKHPPSVPILQAEIELPTGWDPALTKVWFDTDETRFFYWLIPESSTRAVVGLVGDERAQMRHLLRRFMDRQGLKASAYQGARIALYHPRLKASVRVGEAQVLLVGDAAGQVKVTTVGGTVSGLLGADAAVRACIQGTSYARELRAVTRELELHWWMRNALDRFGNGEYDRLVRVVSTRIREFLAAHNRDEMAGVAWQLPFLQPQLLTLAPYLLLRALRHKSAKPTVPAPAQD